MVAEQKINSLRPLPSATASVLLLSSLLGTYVSQGKGNMELASCLVVYRLEKIRNWNPVSQYRAVDLLGQAKAQSLNWGDATGREARPLN